ncbi:MAG: hypothetical protein Fur0010_24290 [Bdellovibrio sp.]
MKLGALLLSLFLSLNLYASKPGDMYGRLGDLNIDPDSIMCTLSWTMIYKPVVAKLPGSDKLKHCTMSCMVALNCNEETTFLIGLLKELADMMGQGNPEFGDILANIKGIELSRDLDTQLMCYPTCKQHF